MRCIKKITAVMLTILITVCAFSIAVNDVKAIGQTAGDSNVTAEIIRFGGTDRIDTANKIADAGWNSADTVFLANGYTYADALAGAPLAYAYNAPILLIDGKTVSAGVKAELTRLGVKNIYLLGGNAAITSNVESYLKSGGYNVTRVWGATRYETAIEIAKALMDKKGPKAGETTEVFIASGANYPDALSASPIAAIKGSPILYSPSDGELDTNTMVFIKNNSMSTAYVLGGSSAVGHAVSDKLSSVGVNSGQRIGGADRFETALLIAEYFDSVFTSSDVSFATGRNFPDALAGGVFAAKKGIPVLLTDDTAVNIALKDYVNAKEPDKAYVFGGTTVVSDEIVRGHLSVKTVHTSSATSAAATTTTITTATSTTTTTAAKGTTATATVPFAPGDTTFILNTGSKCFHLDANCRAALKIASGNRAEIKSTMESVKAHGYWACGYCAKAYK